MTNLEFYKEEIEKINKEGHQVAVVDGKPMSCCKECDACDKCELHHRPAYIKQGCGVSRTMWLMEEHNEKFTISLSELSFLELLSNKFYIARDCSGMLYVYNGLPVKDGTFGVWRSAGYNSLHISKSIFKHVKFDFIRYEDENPWSVGDLIKLEVRE